MFIFISSYSHVNNIINKNISGLCLLHQFVKKTTSPQSSRHQLSSIYTTAWYSIQSHFSRMVSTNQSHNMISQLKSSFSYSIPTKIHFIHTILLLLFFGFELIVSTLGEPRQNQLPVGISLSKVE